MIQSHLEIQVHPGQRKAAIAALGSRRIFEECAETVRGFLGVELLLPEGAPDTLYIIARWQDRDSVLAWLASPVREAQNSDLARFAATLPTSRIMIAADYTFARLDSEYK